MKEVCHNCMSAEYGPCFGAFASTDTCDEFMPRTEESSTIVGILPRLAGAPVKLLEVEEVKALAEAFARYYQSVQDINKIYTQNIIPLLKEPDKIDDNSLYTWDIPEDLKQQS